MKRLTANNHDKKLPALLLASFAAASAVILAVYIASGMQPFGKLSILTSDMLIQYKDYYGYLWDVLHGQASLDYSFSKSLGGGMAGLVAYYLTCPLNLFVYFVEKTQIPLFFSVITALKLAFSALTSSYYLRKRFSLGAVWCVLLSVCYAMCEYSLVYAHNIMWLDGVVMLPLVCLGVWQSVKSGKKGLLFFSVFMAIFSNWYSGYMVCLMGGFVFLFELFLKYAPKTASGIKAAVRPALADCVRTAAAMVLGVLASGALLIPALLSLLGGKAGGFELQAKINVGVLESLKGFMINAQSNKSDATIMYCGAVVLVLALYMMLDKKADKRRRILSALFFAFMISCFCIEQLNVMWTGFIKSYSYQFRWAFVFAFLTVAFAAAGIKQIKAHGFSSKTMLASLGIAVGVFLLLELAGCVKDNLVSYIYILLVVAVGLGVAASFSVKSKRLRSLIALCLCLVTFAELAYNGVKAFEGNYYVKADDFVEYTQEMSAVMDNGSLNEDGFYRTEKSVSYLTEKQHRENANSESLMYGYAGISGYTSTYDPNVDIFLAKMGYCDSTSVNAENQGEKRFNPTDTYWNSPQLVADSLLGIKYMITSAPAPAAEKLSGSECFDSKFAVYENTCALPLAYNVSSGLYDGVEYTKNPFENQERFVSAALGREASFFFEPEYESGEMISGTQKITVHIARSGPLYFYTDPVDVHKDSNGKKCELFVNGESVQKICSRFCTNAVYIGDFSAGDTVRIEIRCSDKNTQKNKSHTVCLAQLDEDAAKSALSSLASGSSSLLELGKNTVSGIYKTDADSTVMLTVPYDEGWSLTVDGEKAQYKMIADTFIGIDLPAGEHQIEMEYKTPHRALGAVSSVVGFAGFALWCAAEYALKKKKERSSASR